MGGISHDSKRRHKDSALVFLCYIGLYSFLAGFYFLMLKGVIASSRSHSTLLWSFFAIGIIFSSAVSFGVYVSQTEEKNKLASSMPESSRDKSNTGSAALDGSLVSHV